MSELIELAERCEKVEVPTKVLDREIALAVGWVRLTPSEAGRKHPAWFHPDDCRDGKVIYDSLHGTDVWRDPLAYTASLDAAVTLVPEGWTWAVGSDGGASVFTSSQAMFKGRAATPALALCAAALCARAALSTEEPKL